MVIFHKNAFFLLKNHLSLHPVMHQEWLMWPTRSIYGRLLLKGRKNILGFCLGENHWCDYIEGDTTFICVIAGFNAEELTPKYPDFISERVYALHAAARWWYEYRDEVL